MITTVTLNPSLDEWMALPSLRVGQLNRASHFARYPGGKGINVSRVVKELGAHTLALGVAGGEDGLILRHLLNQLSIRHRFLDIEGSTRNNYKIRTEHPRALTEINAAGPRVSPAVLRALERALLGQRPRPRCVILSGSLPPGVPPTIYQRWIRLLRRVRVPVVLDAAGTALRAGLAARPWLMKPNRQETEELVGHRLRSRAAAGRAAQRLVAAGPSVAILSLGPDGAVLAAAEFPALWHAIPPTVTVRSTVGSGDSLVGGFLVGWMRTRSLADSLRLGVACGTASAMTPGTELCHRADVERLLRRVRVHRLT